MLSLGVLAGCGGSSNGGNSGSSPKQLTFAVVPAENASQISQQFAPFIKFVSARVGVPIKFVASTSYAAVLEALRAGKADIALLGPLSYVIAKNQGIGVDIVGAQIPAKGVAPSYRSLGVVGKSSTISSLAQAKGKKVCFADPSSTSGYLYPYQALLAAGVNPQTQISSVFAGGPDKTAIGAAKGQCDLGFSFDAMVEQLLPQAGLLKPGDVRVIWRSTPIPGSPIVIRGALSPALKQKLTGAILQANTDAFKQAGLCPASGKCGVSGAYAYVRVSDSFYDTVRQACAATKVQACQKP